MKKNLTYILFLFLLNTVVVYASEGEGSKKMPNGLYALMETSKGLIRLKLYYKKTPMTVCNFAGLATGEIENSAKPLGSPYYDGLTFHRVIKGFMIQGGDPTGTGRGGPGYKFPDEFVDDLRFDGPGVLAMANAGPATNGSQFFITHSATHHLDRHHTIFGEVIDGQDVVNSIERGDKILSVKIEAVGDSAAAFAYDQPAFNKLLNNYSDRRKALLKKERGKVMSEIKEKYPDAIETESGLFYVVEKSGEGESPKMGDMITAHYTGKLLDGTVFDSSVKRGRPFQFQVGVGQVISGWDEAFLTMKRGEKRLIILPPELGYGSQGAGGVIPPNAWLEFDVELLDF